MKLFPLQAIRLGGLAAVAMLAACMDQDSPTASLTPGNGPSLQVQGSTRTDLGTLGGTTSTAYAISATGQVVGTSKMADASTRAFSWTSGGGMIALPAGTTHAYGVNASGVIVGRGVFGTAVRGFVYSPAGGGTVTQLPLGVAGASSGEARGINDAGQIVGFSTVSGTPRAVLWTPSGGGGYQVTPLGDFGGGQGQALDINSHGRVVGWATTAGGDYQAFRWDPTSANAPTGTLNALPSGTRNAWTAGWYPSQAYAINDSGQVAGWNQNGWFGSTRMPARWDPGAARPVFMGRAENNHFRAYGEARGLNAGGTLLAGFYDGRAFAWTPGSDPLELSAPAGTAQAFDMATDGTIVGWAGGVAAIWRSIVTNTVPVAVLGGPYFMNPGDTIVFDGGASYDVDLDSLTYTWMVGSTSYPGQTFSFTESSVIRRTLWLIVTDDDGKADTAATDIYVNHKPVAQIAGADSLYIVEGGSVPLDGSGSHDADGNPLSYAWAFGDGTVEDDASVNKTYQDNGVFAARLIVTDSWSRADTAVVTVFVSNVAPRATFAKGAGQEGSTRTLELINVIEPSSTDRGSLEYAFNCGSGFGPYGSSASYVCPAVPDQDTVTVMARVRDKDGGASPNYVRAQYIANVLPVVTATPSATTVNVGDLVTLAGSSFTDPGADSPWTWTYTWGDGAVSRGGTSTHTLPPNGHRYTVPGTYTLNVSVRDDRGFGHAAPITITVNP